MNAYLLEGDPLTLVDVGPKTPSALSALKAGLARNGYALADIEQIVVTHRHNDHFGLTATARVAGNPVVAASRIDAAFMEDALEAFRLRNRRLAKLFQQHGVPAAKQAEIDAFFDSTPDLTEASRIDRRLEDGEMIRAGGADWQILHTPGHCVGHICLYQPESRILISGDHLLDKISSNPLVEPTSDHSRLRTLAQYLQSLRRIAELEVSEVLPAHGGTIADHREVIAERLLYHERRKEAVRAIVGNRAMTTYEINQQMFPDLTKDGIFLGISEVLGHLDLLEMEGVLEIEHCGDLLYYRLASLVPSA